MPPLVALGIAAGVAGGAATAYGASKASDSAAEANRTTAASNSAAIEEQKRQDAQQKAEFDQQQALAKQQWDAAQAIRAPYRQAGQVALGHLGDLLGVNFNPALIPQAQPFQATSYAGPSSSRTPQPLNPQPTAQPNQAQMQLRALMPQGQSMSPGAVQIRDNNGMIHTFASQAQADTFKQQAMA